MSAFEFDLRGEPIALAETLDCGQAFRWRAMDDGSYSGVVDGELVAVSLRNCALQIAHTAGKRHCESFWRNYFVLDVDYKALHKKYAKDATLAECVKFAPGIRVLRQEFFETLISFIVSQNNNIKRIKKIVEGLCDSFGPEVGTDASGVVRHAFPTCETLAALTPDDLAPLKAGYRVDFILRTSRAFADDSSLADRIRAMDTANARRELLALHGVGPKVADCVLLFGLSRFESFPVDVWVRRAMAQLFPAGLPACAADTAGIAQQYIFNYARLNA